ncbi:MAG TPA: FtsW/RodA/SpoVE family cell cycle protein, partial [Verrucomicrobiota bacterium]|nr:FtsW/RodA/SpoVE family cell cycle protein [Verrucomicrobiota bacterium]
MFAVLAAWWRALSAPRRVAYASAAVLLGAGVVASGAPIEVMVGLWIAANGAFLVRLAVWGLLHPAAVVRARDAILGWALAVAVSLTLLLHSGFAQLLAQISEVWIPNGLLFFAAVVGLLPLLFIVGLTAGMIVLQPDLSAAATVVLLGILLFFLAGGDLKKLLIFVVFVVGIGAVVVSISRTGQARISDYLSGLKDLTGSSY